MSVHKLYESDNYLVVNKPYDMYINSEDKKEKNTVAHHIASGDSHHANSINPIHFVQRLDYSTSGVLCIAKNRIAAAAAGKLFEKREVQKYYLAVVRGHVKHELCDIEYDVGLDSLTADTSHRMLARTDKISVGSEVSLVPSCSSSSSMCILPRKAHTRLLALETGYYDNAPVTICLLKPVTGRRHQLRVHCAAIGHLILGDYTYSGGTDNSPHRMFLHAMRLVLPLKDEYLDIMTAEPFLSDKQFVAKWKSLRCMHRFQSRDDFLINCDILDKVYVLGVRYKHFICS